MYLRWRHFKQYLFTALTALITIALDLKLGGKQAFQFLGDPVVQEHDGNYEAFDEVHWLYYIMKKLFGPRLDRGNDLHRNRENICL